MKTIGQLPALLCVAVVAVVHCTLYVRIPLLDKAEVHTERIGGSFAYKTTELLAYSPIVYNYNVPNVPCTFAFPISCQHPWFVASVHADVESQLHLEPDSEIDIPELIHDSVATLADNDTVTIHASSS